MAGRLAVVLTAAALVLECGCGSSAPLGAGRSPSPSPPTAGRPTAGRPTAGRPIWLQPPQMVTPLVGWALGSTISPASSAPPEQALVRTVNGGRTWTNVTPPAARALLAGLGSYPVLLASAAGRAWLAVTTERSESSYGTTPHRTEVFGTTNAGRTWASLATIRAPGNARFLVFATPANGWLFQDLGAAMQQNHLELYRTRDGGASWSLIARTVPWPRSGTSRSGLPTFCDKTGIVFATPRVGWITGACNGLADAFLVSRDGGVSWTSQPLPIPDQPCQRSGCQVAPPQFFGATGFLAVTGYPGPGQLLVSHDTGATWRTMPLPPGDDPDPTVRFFDARHGLLIPGHPQGGVGRVFYVTSDGGRAWRPIRQGGPAVQPGPAIEFVSLRYGFAWDMNGHLPVLYATSNGGRTWRRLTPLG